MSEIILYVYQMYVLVSADIFTLNQKLNHVQNMDRSNQLNLVSFRASHIFVLNYANAAIILKRDLTHFYLAFIKLNFEMFDQYFIFIIECYQC